MAAQALDLMAEGVRRRALTVPLAVRRIAQVCGVRRPLLPCDRSLLPYDRRLWPFDTSLLPYDRSLLTLVSTSYAGCCVWCRGGGVNVDGIACLGVLWCYAYT